MTKLFELCGYRVNSTPKECNPILNIFDAACLVAYIFFSLINLRGSDPSWSLLFVNATIMNRFIVKNIVELNKVKQSGINDGKKAISLIHVIKIAVEITIMIVLTISFVYFKYKMDNLMSVKFIVCFVLIVTFIEDFIGILERLYNAVPKPLLY